MGIIADVCALVMVILGMFSKFSKSNGFENLLCFIAAAIFMVAGAIYDHSKKEK